jgi:hypothetical protein
MKDLRETLQKSRELFIFYHARGLADKKWLRSNSMYFMWSVFPNDEGVNDFILADIWERVINDHYSPSKESIVNNPMLVFDLMEKYIKVWVFS